jgi:carbon monoxide dehydrogenase subunit G
MEINDSFRVSTPIDATWKVMLDIEGIAPCLPGAQLQEIDGDEFRGVVKVKVGPITAQYKGTAKLAEVDEVNRRIVIDASGRDTRGQGNAKATIVVTMAAEGGGTKVDVATDLAITGKVAQFGRGVLADVSSKLMGQFVENVERDVLSTAGGGDTSHEGGAYEQALASAVTAPAPSPSPTATGTAPVGTGSASTGPRKIDSKEVAPVDLFEVAGAPVTKRLIPIGIGALVLFVLWRLIRRG